jgi:hypothetical protein
MTEDEAATILLWLPKEERERKWKLQALVDRVQEAIEAGNQMECSYRIDGGCRRVTFEWWERVGP